MKRKLFSMLLCFMMVFACFSGCGQKEPVDNDAKFADDKDKDDKREDSGSDDEKEDKDNSDNDGKGDSKGEDNVSVEDNKNDDPSKLLSGKLQDFSDIFEKMTENANTDSRVDITDGLGFDMSVEVKPSRELVDTYGLTGLEKAGIELAGDFGEIVNAALAVSLNGDKLIEGSVSLDNENLYVSLPRYADAAMSVELEEILGDSLENIMGGLTTQISDSMEGMPTPDEIVTLFTDFISDLGDCVKYSATESGQSITVSGVTVTGEKHRYTVESEDVEKALERFVEEAKKYPALNVETDTSLGENTTLTICYIENEDEIAFEIISDEDASKLGFVSTARKVIVNVSEDDESFDFLVIDKQSEKKGTIRISDEYGEEQVTLYYDNLTDHSVDVTFELEGNQIAISYSMDGDEIAFTISVSAADNEVVMQIVGTDSNLIINLTAAVQGMNLGSATVRFTVRDYKKTAIPSYTVSMDEWGASLKQDKLLEDLQEWMTKYPFLTTLVEMASDAGSGDTSDLTDENNRNNHTTNTDYTGEFSSFTGFEVDEDNYVDFYPLESEVLAAGKPSTGYVTLPVTQNQANQLISLAEGLYSNVYASENSYYSIYGSLDYDSVQSYYSHNYAYYNEDEFSNNVNISFEAITGEMIGFSVSAVERSEAIDIMNRALEICGIDYRVTADNYLDTYYNNGISIGGFDGSDYTYLTLSFY